MKAAYSHATQVVPSPALLRNASWHLLADSSARDRNAGAECFTRACGMARRRGIATRGAAESKAAASRIIGHTNCADARRARISNSGMCAYFIQEAKLKFKSVCSASILNEWGASSDSTEVPSRAAKDETTSLRRSVSSRARCARLSDVLQTCPRHCNLAQPVPTVDAAAVPSIIVST